LPPPRGWYLDRPAELVNMESPSGPRFGAPGPDLGYGLKLARRLEDQVILAAGEHLEDAVAGCFASGCRRAAHSGRAPVIYDMQWSYGIWGFLGGAPEDLVAWRRPLFAGAAEHYWEQRQIVDAIRTEALALSPAQVLERLASWRELLIV
jgi:hypothetical protein